MDKGVDYWIESRVKYVIITGSLSMKPSCEKRSEVTSKQKVCLILKLITVLNPNSFSRY